MDQFEIDEFNGETFKLLTDYAGDCRYPDIFPPSAAEAFDSAFDISGSEQQVDDDMLSAAHFMLRPFMLRRVKADVEKRNVEV